MSIWDRIFVYFMIGFIFLYTIINNGRISVLEDERDCGVVCVGHE